MQNSRQHVLGRSHRHGTVLVITAIVLIALVGLLGLVIDGGQMMTAHRSTQNAADAAATAAAMDLSIGNTKSTATATATSFVQQYNGLLTATVTVNIPPASGPHAGNSNYAEAIVSRPMYRLWFIPVLGDATLQTVTARAVAGTEGVNVSAGVIALDTNARPGIGLSGNGTLKVNGSVLVNSQGGGLTASGQPINNGNTGDAISTSGNGSLYATSVQSAGGVSNPSAIMNFNTKLRKVRCKPALSCSPTRFNLFPLQQRPMVPSPRISERSIFQATITSLCRRASTQRSAYRPMST